VRHGLHWRKYATATVEALAEVLHTSTATMKEKEAETMTATATPTP